MAFETLGFEVCTDGTLEDGYEKVAVYVGVDGRQNTRLASFLVGRGLARWERM